MKLAGPTTLHHNFLIYFQALMIDATCFPSISLDGANCESVRGVQAASLLLIDGFLFFFFFYRNGNKANRNCQVSAGCLIDIERAGKRKTAKREKINNFGVKWLGKFIRTIDTA